MTPHTNDTEQIRTTPNPLCYLCGEHGEVLYSDLSDRIYSVEGDWSIRKCVSTDCGLVWLDPKPIDSDIPKLYSEYVTHCSNKSSEESADPVSRLVNMLVDRTYPGLLGYPNTNQGVFQRVLTRLVSWVGPLREMIKGELHWVSPHSGNRLLDVGCGAGRALERLSKLGWEVQGVEPDPGGARTARSRGIPVFEGTVEEVPFPDESFDVITSSHVIEHLPDPGRTLRRLFRLLTPGGKLIVLTPNTASFGTSHFGRHSIQWDPPRHLHLFDMKSLCTLLEREGYEVVSRQTPSRQAPFVYRYSRRIRERGHVDGFSGYIPFFLWVPALLYTIREYLQARKQPIGEELFVEAIRPK